MVGWICPQAVVDCSIEETNRSFIYSFSADGHLGMNIVCKSHTGMLLWSCLQSHPYMLTRFSTCPLDCGFWNHPQALPPGPGPTRCGEGEFSKRAAVAGRVTAPTPAPCNLLQGLPLGPGCGQGGLGGQGSYYLRQETLHAEALKRQICQQLGICVQDLAYCVCWKDK